MNIAVLSRSNSLYSTKRLVLAGQHRGHEMQVLDHLKCHLTIEAHQPELYYEDTPIGGIDAVIPRIGASVSAYGVAVVRHFEMRQAHTTVGSEALLRCRNKFHCHQLLAMAGLRIPKTVYSHYTPNISQLIEMAGGVPVVIKLLEGTHGLGVMLAETPQMAESLIETYYKLKARFLVQEFIPEAGGKDVRALVVGKQVVAAMIRQARPGDFRSNLHRGGSAVKRQLSKIEAQTAIKAAQVMGLPIAGVDMLLSNKGPMVLEVNPSPGLEGIEKASGVDIAGKIIEYLESEVAKPNNRKQTIHE